MSNHLRSKDSSARVSAPVGRRLLPTALMLPILAFLVIAPSVVVVWSAFKPTGFIRDPGFSLSNFVDAYGDPGLVGVVINTLVFAGGSALVALLAAVPLSWLLERTQLPAKRLLRGLVILPMATPPLLLAIAWTMLLNPRTGALNSLLGTLPGPNIELNIYSMGGMIFVQALTAVPSAFLIIAPAFRGMDPSLEEAALISGASAFTIIRRITLPLVKPAILAAGMFLTIAGFVVFDVPGVIGLPGREHVLSSRIYAYAKLSPSGLPLYGQIGALTVIILAFLLALSFSYRKMTSQSQKYVTMTGKGYRQQRLSLGRWRFVGLGFVLAYFALAVAAPLGILVWTSLLPYATEVSRDSFSLLSMSNYREILTNDRIAGATKNTLIVAIVAATVVTVLSPLVSWIVVKSRAVGRGLIDFLAFAPMALVGVMIGVALTTLYLALPIPIFGTIWIIALAFITVYIAFGSRVTHGVMHQLHPELEEAAQTSGASWLLTFRKVTIPLISPALFGVWIWVASHSIRELSAALMLQGRDNVVVSTLLWNYWDTGRAPMASAVGVGLIGGLIVLVILWQVAGGRSGLGAEE